MSVMVWKDIASSSPLLAQLRPPLPGWHLAVPSAASGAALARWQLEMATAPAVATVAAAAVAAVVMRWWLRFIDGGCGGAVATARVATAVAAVVATFGRRSTTTSGSSLSRHYRLQVERE